MAVLGCEVMALTSATLLVPLNLRVTIYAKAFSPHTTSNVAGGQWASSLVEHSDTQQFDRILRRSFATHSSGLCHPVGRTPIFLARLQSDLAAAGAQFVQREFLHVPEVASLEETIVISCTGLVRETSGKIIW